MDVSIQEIKDYTYIVIKIQLSFFKNSKHSFNFMQVLVQP